MREHQSFLRSSLEQVDGPELVPWEFKDQPSAFIIDPPRRGFKQLKLWTDAIRPELIVYVSCDSSTLARDLKLIHEDYSLKCLKLYGFFPGTYHYESMAFLVLK